MKKLLSLILVLMLVASLFVGCGPKEEEPAEPTDSGEPAPVEEVREMTVYIRMMESQDKWFQDNIIREFENEYNAKINVRSFENVVDLMSILDLDKDQNSIGLVKTEASMLYPLAEKGYMIKLSDIPGVDVAADFDEYLDKAVELSTVNGEIYYVPRKLETNTLLYLQSKVDDALANWMPMKADIDAMFKAENGYGLPADYTLESDPNMWDWYDLGVVGYYWSNTEYDGVTEAKIAHRGKDYSGTQTELVTKAFQAGATQEEVLSMTGDAIVDTFEWEVFMKENGLYNPAMWDELWSGGGIWGAMAKGQVYMAFMHQIDAFFIHGGTDPSMTGYLLDPDDMAVAVMPAGASLEMVDGVPVRMGDHASQLSGWCWGIPESSPNAELSYELARFITNAENHKAEASTFGMMPVRKDIMADLGSSFEEEWIQKVFETAVMQVEGNVTRLPIHANWPAVGQLYNNAWYDIVIDGNNGDVAGSLAEYAAEAAELIK
jgi:maltose-binding protein MalE